MKSLPSLLTLLVLFFTRAAFGYGNAGHEAVGNIAAHYLAGTPAEAEVRKLLRPGEELSKACTWADRAKLPDQYLSDEMKDFVAHNPEHHSYHFCDVPFQEKSYRDGGTGTKPVDIVHMMRFCIEVLQDPKAQAKDPRHITPRVALLLLAHYTADIHQPLHVGCSYVDPANHFVDPDQGAKGQEDAGANFFKLTKSTTLHGYWDTVAVKKARDQAQGADFATWLIANNPPQPSWATTGPLVSWPQKWATDTLHFSAAYKGVKLSDRHSVPVDERHPAHDEWKVTLPPVYDLRATTTVELELAKAGYRLAELLKAIWR